MFCVYNLEVLLYSSSLPQAGTALSFSLWWWKFILTHKLALLLCHIQQSALRNDGLHSLLAGDVKRKGRGFSFLKHLQTPLTLHLNYIFMQFVFLIRVNSKQGRAVLTLPRYAFWQPRNSALWSLPNMRHHYSHHSRGQTHMHNCNIGWLRPGWGASQRLQ